MRTPPHDTCCVVVGAGIGGVNAALWLRDLRVPFQWFERAQVGGLLWKVRNPIENASGGVYPEGGARLVEEHVAQLRALGDLWPQPREVQSIEIDAQGATLSFAHHGALRARFVILATGTRARRLNIPGEDGPRVFRSASAHAQEVQGQEVAVVGGGDAALEGALILARHGCTVHLLCRSAPTGARPSFVEQAGQHPRVRMWPIPTVVEALEPHSDSVRARLLTQARAHQLDVHAVFVRIGVEPVLPALSVTPALDARGYVQVDADQRSTLEPIFAVGDLSAHPLQAIVKAAGDGARAAHAVARQAGYVAGA